MPEPDPASEPSAEEAELSPHPRWARTPEDTGFFADEDGLRRGFYLLFASGAGLLGLLAAGLWRLQAAALAPPPFVGIARGLVFTGRPGPLSSLRDDDFEPQFADTVEALFSRTEKGLPEAIGQFCSPEVVGAVERAYRGGAARYPAGYVQTLAILEEKTIASRPGYRRMYYRGLLSSRSVAAAQTSPIYLDCTFAVRGPAPLNAAGWRLVEIDALSRDDYHRPERERAARELLRAPAPGGP